MRKFTCLIAIAVCVTGLAVTAKADIIYNNFGPGDTYFTANGWAIRDGFGGLRQYIANSFTPGNSYTLDSITLAAQVLSGTSSLTVDLRTNAGGIPGGILESWVFTSFSLIPSVQSMNSLLHPTLNAGSLYWFEVRTTNPTTEGGWNWSLTDSGPFVFSQDGGATWLNADDRRSVFRVEGTPTTLVPEPGSMVLLGSGLAGLIAARRRKRTGTVLTQ